jgi:hypothetical protein
MTTPNAAEGRRDDAELAEFLAEMMHTGYRHGIDNQQAMQIWRLIQEMPDRDWGAYAGYVSHYLQQYLDKRDTSLIVRLEAAERVVAMARNVLRRPNPTTREALFQALNRYDATHQPTAHLSTAGGR